MKLKKLYITAIVVAFGITGLSYASGTVWIKNFYKNSIQLCPKACSGCYGRIASRNTGVYKVSDLRKISDGWYICDVGASGGSGLKLIKNGNYFNVADHPNGVTVNVNGWDKYNAGGDILFN